MKFDCRMIEIMDHGTAAKIELIPFIVAHAAQKCQVNERGEKDA